MKGIEISRAFYEEYGKPMIENEFSEYSDRIAVGLVGHGSECFGFDDEISCDHDYEPGFCLWLTEEDEKAIGFKLFRAYSKLPDEYMGLKLKEKSAFGNNFKGVMTIPDFYKQYTGRAGAPETMSDWLYTPSHYLAEATNGEIFFDRLGDFSKIREEIKHGMPEDVRLKKIASCALLMAQTGQYNYSRCLSHGEGGAARLALSEFVKQGIETVFLLNKEHMPYYKWAFRAMSRLPILGKCSKLLACLLDSPNSNHYENQDKIEEFCSAVITEFKRQGISNADSEYLESHAYNKTERIADHALRNMPIIL